MAANGGGGKGDNEIDLFEDIFHVHQVNPDGDKKFDNVARILAKSETYGADVTVDIYSQVFPVKAGEMLSIKFVTTINVDGTPDTGKYDPTDRETLLDEFDYAMYGKVFRYDIAAKHPPRATIIASYGGLLMKMEGNREHFTRLRKGQRIYMLMRKVTSS